MTAKFELLLLSLLSFISISMAATDCFTQVGDVYTIPSNFTYRVSKGIDCPVSERNTTCPLETGGVIGDISILNITIIAEEKVYDAIRHATNGTFEHSVDGSVANLTYQVSPGYKGFYGFTATLYCYAGTLGDCIGGDVPAGTAVAACEPRKLARSNDLDGTGGFVVVDDISTMTSNPAAHHSHLSTAHSILPNGILGIAVGAFVLWYFF